MGRQKSPVVGPDRPLALGEGTILHEGAVSAPVGMGTNTADVGIEPDVQYFVVYGLSLGGVVSIDWNKIKAEIAGWL
jgi:hypothetical protein